ncbi:MAG TPA: hypothetical protein VN577_17580 [Terriglobales bacterium]|nr:hypothetical protein [Terriglobales bacterium]
MSSRPLYLNDLITDLRRVEKWLSSSLGVSIEHPDDRNTPNPFSPHDDMADLKCAIDRIRPLLWVYLNRQSETRNLKLKNKSAGVRTLMDEALSISDRYVSKD